VNRYIAIDNKKAKRDYMVGVETKPEKRGEFGRSLYVASMSNGSFMIDSYEAKHHSSMCLSKESAEYLLVMLFSLQKEHLRDVISTKTRIDCLDNVTVSQFNVESLVDNESIIDKIVAEKESHPAFGRRNDKKEVAE